MKGYSKILIEGVSDFLGESQKMNIWGCFYDGIDKRFMSIMSIHFNEKQPHATIKTISNKDIEKILNEMEGYCNSKFSQPLCELKIMKYYKGDTIYMVKPFEKCFWSEGMAMYDANEIIGTLINS